MPQPGADVRSIEALALFRAALLEFCDNAKVALAAMNMDIERSQTWLESQARHWHSENRKAEDDVTEASQLLRRKKLWKIGDRPVDTTHEEAILRRAKRRLEFVQDRQEKTTYWLRSLSDEMLDFQGPARQLGGMLEQGIPRMAALLQRKIDLLESYARDQ